MNTAMKIPGAVDVTTTTEREIRLIRAFNAPRALVFEAFTKPAHVRRWLIGAPGTTMPVCEIDLRVGGGYRYVWRSPMGEMGLRGVFREVVPPARIVSTEIFDQDWTGGETVVTTVFTATGGKTTLTMTIVYASKAARDGAMATGMTEGMAGGFNMLDEVLASLM